MTAKLSGMRQLTDALAALPEQIERNVLRGALRAAAEVVADEARTNCIDPLVRKSINTSARSERGLVTSKIKTSGPGAYRAPWEEFGTLPHFISVRAEGSGGRTVRKVNRDLRAGSLIIGGNFVGDGVRHPGERRHAFFRPALDHKTVEAIAAAEAYVRSRLTIEGLAAPADKDDEE